MFAIQSQARKMKSEGRQNCSKSRVVPVFPVFPVMCPVCPVVCPVCPLCRTGNGDDLLALNAKCRSIAPLHRRDVHSTLTRPAVLFLRPVVSRLGHACVAGNFLRSFEVQWLVPVCISCPSSCLCDGEGKTKTHHSTKLQQE